MLQSWLRGIGTFVRPQSKSRKQTSKRKPRPLGVLALEARVTPSSSPFTMDPSSYTSDTILVQFGPQVFDPATLQILPGVSYGETIDLVPGLRIITLSNGMSVTDAIAAFEASPFVTYAQPDYIYTVDATMPNDPSFGSLWGLHNVGQSGGTVDADIDAPEAWDISQGSGTTIVAVIDTGVRWSHQDLAANMWTNPGEIAGNSIDDDANGRIDDIYGYDFYNNDNNPMDDHGHGTHCAGTIGGVGNNSIGVTGVNWRVKIMALKFMSASGSGPTSAAINCLNYAVSKGATISSNSWGGGGYDLSLYNAINAARASGHIFVAAAGNGAVDNDFFFFSPANHNLDNVISVASTDRNDAMSGFSQWGLRSVDLGAPGSSIFSTYATNDTSYATLSGTSMACPHVAGVVALVKDAHPTWNYLDVIGQVLQTTDRIPSLAGRTVTGGRLNAYKALAFNGGSVFSTSVSGITPDPVSSIRVTFHRAMDPGSFGSPDVTSFVGPYGIQIPVTVNVVPGSGNRQFDLGFATQTYHGVYNLTLGPNITTEDGGFLMDQDHDGVNGEATQDQYTINFTLGCYGPDGSAYVAGDYPYESLNLAPGGPGVTTLIDQGDDPAAVAINLGTSVFRFYGTNYSGASQLFVGTNGIITFGSGFNTSTNNIMTSSPAQPAIAPLWDDWWTNGAGSGMVLYRFDDLNFDSIMDRLIVEWNSVKSFDLQGTSQTATFQAILQLNTGGTNGNIIFNYNDTNHNNLDFNNAQSSTIGIKANGTQGANRLLVTANNDSNPFIGSNRAVIFYQNIAPTANSGGPYAINEGATGMIFGGLSADPNEASDELVYDWDLDNDGIYGEIGPAASLGYERGLIVTFDATSFDGPTSRTIGLRVTDCGGLTSTIGGTVNILNVAPTATFSNSGGVAEGSNLVTFSFASPFDPGTADTLAGFLYSYDFNNDGDFSDPGDIADSASASQNFNFNDSGNYTVRGQIKDKDGGATNYTTSVTITNVSPTATLSNDGPAIEGNTVTISFSAQADPSNADVSAGFLYSYDFNNDGDFTDPGEFVDSAFTSRTWATVDSGSLTVHARIKDKDGGFNDYFTNVVATNVAPTALLGNIGTLEGGSATVSFTGVFDPSVIDSTSLTYSYDFNNDGDYVDAGDLLNVTQLSATFLFDDNGSYPVSARVLDKDGGENTYTTTVVVLNVDPTATLGAISDPNEGGTTTYGFSNQFDPSNADTVAGFLYSFDFNNDGDYTDPGDVQNVTTSSYTVVYGDDGSFTIRARIEDKDGGFTEATQTIVIQNVAPLATFGNGGTVSEAAAASVSFTNPFDPSNADTLAGFTYSYDFNNDGDFTDPNEFADVAQAGQPVTFDDNGTYTIRGRIKDKDGGSTDYFTQITVTNVEPTALFANGGSVNEATAVSVSFANQLDPSTTDTLAGFVYSYDFNNDGDFNDPGDLQDVAAADGSFTFDDSGTYTINARIKDKDGGFSTYSTTVTVLNVAPVATVSGSGPVIEGKPITINFADQSDVSATDTAAGFVYSYDFNNDGDFDDAGDLLNIPNPSPSFVFTHDGTFTIHAQIMDKDGGASDYTTTVQITNVDIIVTGSDKGGTPSLKVYDANTRVEKFAPIIPYDFLYKGGVRVAVGDVTGDGVPDIIAAPGSGGNIVLGTISIKVFDGVTGQKVTGPLADLKPFGERFKKGMYIASADFNNDGFSDIVVAPATGFNPQVKVISGANGMTLLHDITAFPIIGPYKKGVRVAVGDVNGDGTPDIIAHGGSGKTSLIHVFDGSTGQQLPGTVGEFNPFADQPKLKGGMFVAAGDLNGDGNAEIIAGPSKGAGLFRIFDGVTGTPQTVSLTMPPKYKGGLRVAVGDVTGDGLNDIVLGTGKSRGVLAEVMVLDGTTLSEIDSFFAFDPLFKGGVFVGGGK